jgi:multicomponent Na+:H+ antiporter subunit E
MPRPNASWFLRGAALLRFAAFFLGRSLLGGSDVARRALTPAMPLAIREVEFVTRLRGDGARTLFVAVISLLPGTLACGICGDRVAVHSLAGDPAEPLRRLEDRIAPLFGQNLEPGG